MESIVYFEMNNFDNNCYKKMNKIDGIILFEDFIDYLKKEYSLEDYIFNIINFKKNIKIEFIEKDFKNDIIYKFNKCENYILVNKKYFKMNSF